MGTKKQKKGDKDLDYYLSLRWTWTVEPVEEEGQRYFIIRVNELPGVCTDVEDLADAERINHLS